MFIGFDYGTANCSIAVMQEGEPQLLPLEGDSYYIPYDVLRQLNEITIVRLRCELANCTAKASEVILYTIYSPAC